MSAEKCPICMGLGSVPVGFYPELFSRVYVGQSREQCRGCGGSGVVGVAAPPFRVTKESDGKRDPFWVETRREGLEPR